MTAPRTVRRKALAAALAFVLAAWSPFQAEQPAVREGNEKVLAGDTQAALREYGAAEAAVGAHPEIDYDRGVALQRAGREAEARDAYRRAQDRGASAALASRALQNTGNALAAKGDRAGAIAAFAEALARDPANEDARYDLEVLLRRREEDQKPQTGPKRDQAGGAGGGGEASGNPKPQQGPRPQAGDPTPADQKKDAQGRPEQRPASQPPQAGQRPDRAEQRAGGANDPTAPDRGAPRAGEADAREALTRQQADQLLDALRARERNMPVASPRGRTDARRADALKDW